MDVNNVIKILEVYMKYIVYFFLLTVILAIISYFLLFLRSKLQTMRDEHEYKKQKPLEKELENHKENISTTTKEKQKTK